MKFQSSSNYGFSVDCILAFNIVDWFKKATTAKMVESVTNWLQPRSVVQPGQWDNGDEQFNTSASAAA